MAATIGVSKVWFLHKKRHDKEDAEIETQRKVDIYKSRLSRASQQAVNSAKKANDGWDRIDKDDRAFMIFLATGGDKRK